MTKYLIVGIELIVLAVVVYLGNVGWGNENFMVSATVILIIGIIINLIRYHMWMYFAIIAILGAIIWGLFFYQ